MTQAVVSQLHYMLRLGFDSTSCIGAAEADRPCFGLLLWHWSWAPPAMKRRRLRYLALLASAVLVNFSLCPVEASPALASALSRSAANQLRAVDPVPCDGLFI